MMIRPPVRFGLASPSAETLQSLKEEVTVYPSTATEEGFAHSIASSRSSSCDSRCSEGSQDSPGSPEEGSRAAPHVLSVGGSARGAVTCDQLPALALAPSTGASGGGRRGFRRSQTQEGHVLSIKSRSLLREHIARSHAVAKATAALVRASSPTELCQVLTSCMESFWDGSVALEICLKPAFGPVSQDEEVRNRLALDEKLLLCRRLGEKEPDEKARPSFLGENCTWFGEPIDGHAWGVRHLREHDAMQLCLRRGMRVSDQQRAGPGCPGWGADWLFKETARPEKFVSAGEAPRAHLFVPLHGREGCIGLLHLSAAQPDEFTDAKQESLAPLADALGVQLFALRLQRMLESERRRQQALAMDYRAMLESMLPPHVVDELTKARAYQSRGSLPPTAEPSLQDLPFMGDGSCGGSPSTREPRLSAMNFVSSGAPSKTEPRLSAWNFMSSGSCSDASPCASMTLESLSSLRNGRSRRPSLPHQRSSNLLERLDKLAYAEYHDSVAILFTDIKGFTTISENMEPEGIVVMLDELYGRFDDIIDAYSPVAYKVETIGDAYMVAFGLFEEEPDGTKAAATAVKVAAKMIKAAEGVQGTTKDGSPVQVQIRAGIALGQIMSGIIGKKMPRYCMFGDTVNTGSRMESTGTPGMIHTTDAIREACLGGPTGKGMSFQDSGGREIKGKGFMQTYLLDPEQVLASM